MAVIYEIKERRVVPNWRDYKRTLQLGELSQSNKSAEPLVLSIDRSVEDWKEIKNIGTAADLVNSAFVSGIQQSEVKEAIDFIKSDKGKASSSLLGLIHLIEEASPKLSVLRSNSLLEIDVDTVSEFQAFINNKSFHKVINKTKNRSKYELRNPIVWVDLARLYAMRGHEHKAENAILVALHLAPNNRFVLRSATRFFIHKEKFEKALFYLRKAKNLRFDPWLISAHIATSSIIGRFSPLIKDGKRLIDSNNFSDYELTELSSSLGTLEFKDGSFKKAKDFFDKSMRIPNDNSLAQLEWVSKDEKRFQINPFEFDKVINPFEARALESYERGNWKDAFYNSIKWFLDMPFSKRPALLGSYIAGSLLQDKNAAIILCQVGLQANPHDPTLLNNMVYNLVTSDNNQMLDSYVHQMMEIDIKGLPNESKITFQATLGLVALKRGENELGISLYKAAIQNASNIKSEYLKNLAIANFAKELINLNLPEQTTYVNMIKNMKISENHKDLQLLQNEILEKIKTQPNNG
jgi:tetratricopeptide (TPR) repeat protein